MSDRAISLVTGGAGFIGRHLVRNLLADGVPVRVLDTRADTLPAHPLLERIQGSILDGETVNRAATGVRHVYHLAGTAALWLPRRSDFQRLNGTGTKRVLQAAAEAKVEKTVVTSTDVILKSWKDRSQAPVTEETPLPPRSAVPGAYCRSKWDSLRLAETAAAEGEPVVVLHPTVPIGAEDPSMTPPTQMIADFLSGATPAYLECILDLVAVEDVAVAHRAAAERGVPGRRYIIGGETIALSALLGKLQSLTGRPMPRTRIPFPAALAFAMMSTALASVTRRPPRAPLSGVHLARAPMIVDCSRTRAELGLAQTPVEVALRRLVDWLTAQSGVEAPAFRWAPADAWPDSHAWPETAAGLR